VNGTLPVVTEAVPFQKRNPDVPPALHVVAFGVMNGGRHHTRRINLVRQPHPRPTRTPDPQFTVFTATPSGWWRNDHFQYVVIELLVEQRIEVSTREKNVPESSGHGSPVNPFRDVVFIPGTALNKQIAFGVFQEVGLQRI
jgi:hypothetical protein